MKYDIFKLVLGIFNAWSLLTQSVKYISFGQINLVEVLLGVCIIIATVRVVSFTKKEESAWVFFIGFLAFLSLNIKTAIWVRDVLFIEGRLLSIPIILVVFCVLVSVEELVIGFITRIIWPKQVSVVPARINKDYLNAFREFYDSKMEMMKDENF